MSTKPKKAYGLKDSVEPRSQEKINEEYNREIGPWGHKMATIRLMEEDLERLSKECEEHCTKAMALRKEAAQSLQLQKPEIAPAQASEVPIEAQPLPEDSL